MKKFRISALKPVFASKTRALKGLTLGAMVLATVACTHVPFESDRTKTLSTDIKSDGEIARISQEVTRNNGGRSSFVPLISGTDALGARLRLIEEAESTIDAQYFLMKPDNAGSLFSLALIKAADRGVRVRLLLDDVFTTTTDRQIAFLDQHENIEVRLFNPLSRNSAKAINFLFDFNRVNRRMHNKSLTIDGGMSIVGGRNIADEYFQINSEAEFADLDIFTIGPVTREISDSFDIYWNHKRSVPMMAITSENKGMFKNLSQKPITDGARVARETIYKDAVNSEFLREVRVGIEKPFHGTARVVTDAPKKLSAKPKKSPQLLADTLKQEMLNVESDLLLITPYFVPRRSDIEMFKAIRASGRRVRILTNSLASTNHAYVHGGYAPARKELLRAGVELFEIRADALQAAGDLPEESNITLTMHTKAAILDGKRLFIGSLNYDPRSIEINTEFGMFIDTPELAKLFKDGLLAYMKEHAYSLSLDSNGDIVWKTNSLKGLEVETSDPGAGIWSKFVAGVAAVLPIEGQL